MNRLPMVDFRAMERALLRLGFVRVRQRGRHVFFRHPDGRATSVPNHQGRDLARPLVREILREIGVAPEAFQRELDGG